MTINMTLVLVILFSCILLYILSTICRRGHIGTRKLLGWNYTHRGLHGDGVPENSLLAFQKAVEAGYGAEFDVRLLSDGGLAVLHDSDLERVTGCTGNVEDLTVDQLCQYRLCGTEQTIPDFSKVLEVFAGKAPLIIELKVANNNYASLCEAVCKALEGYDGVYCLESFDPRCVYWLRKNRPDLIRGQLAVNYFTAPNGKKLPWILRLLLTYQMLNFLVLPDFVAYRFSDRKNISNFLIKKLWKAPLVGWPLTTPQEQEEAIKEGWISIFENYLP